MSQSPMPRPLGELLASAGLRLATGEGDPLIAGIAVDSRRVEPGWLYVAVSGTTQDGAAYIQDAVARGAVAVLHSGEGAGVPAGVVELRYSAPRQAWSALAAAWWGNPGSRLRLIGITGTNGKTTTAAMLEAILTAAGERVGVIGTTGMRHPARAAVNPMTTPDPYQLQGWLWEMAAAGCTVVVMETSSHGLAQQRVDGMKFAAGVFTNLTRDHLDYHATVEEYFAAKARLFTELRPGVGVINLADPHGPRLLAASREVGVRVVGFAPTPEALAGEYRIIGQRLSWRGSRWWLRHPGGELELTMPMVGEVNCANALAAAATALELGVTPEEVARGLAELPPVPGRLELVTLGQPFAVVVDYAHTPDALERLIATARVLTPRGRVITVFGCGGERDRGKRAVMGELAARGSDLTVITDDNPRREQPEAIRREILEGYLRVRGDGVVELAERGAAIAHAIGAARAGDGVLIAGKGHEKGQTFARETVPFDDVVAARMALEGLLEAGRSWN